VTRPAAAPFKDAPWTVEEFEEALLGKPADERWELIGGEIVRSMTGGTAAHSRIVVNLAVAIAAGLRKSGRDCDVLTEFGLRTEADDQLFFPDLLVTCEKLDPTATKASQPVLIMEVHSRSTKAWDLGPKLTAYTAIPSLRCYVTFEQASVAARVFTRLDDRGWRTEERIGPDARIVLGEIGLDVALADVYARVFT